MIWLFVGSVLLSVLLKPASSKIRGPSFCGASLSRCFSCGFSTSDASMPFVNDNKIESKEDKFDSLLDTDDLGCLAGYCRKTEGVSQPTSNKIRFDLLGRPIPNLLTYRYNSVWYKFS